MCGDDLAIRLGAIANKQEGGGQKIAPPSRARVNLSFNALALKVHFNVLMFNRYAYLTNA